MLEPGQAQGMGQIGAVGGCAGLEVPALLTDQQLQARVTSRQARCVGAEVDPDEWFPVAARWEQARAEASRALALCAACPVRAECLELSLRQWGEAGRHGVWGGLLETERAGVRPAGAGGLSCWVLLMPGASLDQKVLIPGGACMGHRPFGGRRSSPNGR